MMRWCVPHLKRGGRVRGQHLVAGEWFCFDCWNGSDVKTTQKGRGITAEEMSWVKINRQLFEFHNRKKSSVSRSS